MGRIIIADGLTLRRWSRLDLPPKREWISTPTITGQLYQSLGYSTNWETYGVEVITEYCDDEVAAFQEKYRREFSLTHTGASSLYYSYMNGHPIMSEDGTIRRLAELLGCDSYNISRYIKETAMGYKQIRRGKMTG